MSVDRTSGTFDDGGYDDAFDRATAIVEAVLGLQDSSALSTPGFGIDVIKVVNMDDSGEPGVFMLWHQRERTFGLACGLSQLVADSDDAVVSYLWLAVDEPAKSGPRGETLWYSRLPTRNEP